MCNNNTECTWLLWPHGDSSPVTKKRSVRESRSLGEMASLILVFCLVMRGSTIASNKSNSSAVMRSSFLKPVCSWVCSQGRHNNNRSGERERVCVCLCVCVCGHWPPAPSAEQTVRAAHVPRSTPSPKLVSSSSPVFPPRRSSRKRPAALVSAGRPSREEQRFSSERVVSRVTSCFTSRAFSRDKTWFGDQFLIESIFCFYIFSMSRITSQHLNTDKKERFKMCKRICVYKNKHGIIQSEK